jgi:hypothetical protein
MYVNINFLIASILNIVVPILDVADVTGAVTDIIYFVSHRYENLSNNSTIHSFMFLSVDGGSHHNDEGQVGIKAFVNNHNCSDICKALALGPLRVTA